MVKVNPGFGGELLFYVMTFADRVLDFHRQLSPDWDLPEGYELLFPFSNPDTWTAMSSFYRGYYADTAPRVFLFGINPGRFGAGVTGVPFTDPVRLAERCGIDNPFHKRQELSSVFIYLVVDALGGPAAFYQRYYITSVCPLGFVGNGVNVNYYDDRQLQSAVEPRIIDNFNTQLPFGLLGAGKKLPISTRPQRARRLVRTHPSPAAPSLGDAVPPQANGAICGGVPPLFGGDLGTGSSGPLIRSS